MKTSRVEKIAYIAPEIPGPSSTFVYNEIFALESMGVEIVPFSIHEGIVETTEARLKELKKKAYRVYGRGFHEVLKANVMCISQKPIMYMRALSYCLIYALMCMRRPKVCFGVVYRFFVSAIVASKVIKVDVNHIHAHFMHFPADVAMFSSMMSGVSFSVTAHANDIFCNSWLVRQKGRHAKFISTISQFNIEYLQKMGVRKDALHIIRCGVNVSEFSLRKESPDNAVPVFGFLGRMVEKKGVDILLKASAELKEAGHKFKVELIGDGPLLDDMTALSEKYKLNEIVDFKGNMENKLVFKWLEGIDVFVLPCKKDKDGDMDGIPVAIMEAMLLGVPVISTYLSGIPELVQHGVTGLMAQPDEESDLYMQLLTVIDKSVNLQGVGMRGREKVVGSFSLFNNTKKLLALM